MQAPQRGRVAGAGAAQRCSAGGAPRRAVAPTWRRTPHGARVLNTAQLDKPSPPPATKADPAAAAPAADADDKSKLKAVHAKITAARELARRLAEEKQAVVAASKSEDSSAALLVKTTEEAAAAAAAQAAKADALARKMTRGEGGVGREQLTRLRAENDALKALLLEMAADRRAAQERLADLQSRMAALGGPGAAAAEALGLGAELGTAAAATGGVAAAAARAAVAPAKADELRRVSAAARKAGQRVFTWPTSAAGAGARVGSSLRLYYDRAAGPLPKDARPRVKAGLNKWEEVVLTDMRRCEDLVGEGGQDWWEAELQLPEELFKHDFVVVDATTGAVDNNTAQDFHLELSGGPTEQEVIERRAAAYAEAERKRRAMLAAEEDRQWELVEAVAREAADKARTEFRERRARELLAAATEAVTRTRDPALAALPAAPSVANVYAWLGSDGAVRPGGKMLLAYNCGSGPLAYTNTAKLHLGVDGWKDKQKTVHDMAPLKPSELRDMGLAVDGGNWCGVFVDIPRNAEVLNFVFSDKDQRAWDNNKGRDFHTTVEDPPESEGLVETVLAAMQKEAEAADAAAEELAATRAAHRVESRARVARKRREAQHEVLYTIPLVPRAGEPCELFYNPTVTPLRGRPDVFVSGGFNRWRHPQRHGPTLLQPTMKGGVGFMKAVIDVPDDAHTLDLVFKDAPGGQGFTDDNGGLDYHIPVAGGRGAAHALKVVHVCVEMAPICKVGGMGDVVTALGRAVQDEGHSVEVIVPKYDVINYNLVEDMHQDGSFFFENCQVKVWKGKVEGLPTTFLEPENGHFWRGCIYGRNDDHVRFAYFCGAALEYLKVRNVQPDVVHAHDWPSAPACWGNRGAAGCVFTIHNLNYGADLIGRAMGACDVATTVSPTYAREISGSPPIAPHLSKMYGIRNGIDQDIWDPSADEFLPVPYGPDNFQEGKAAARAELRRRMGLADVDVPIVSVVTRLVHQKGIHLIKHAAWRTLERGGQFVLLGSAPDGRVQGEFNALRDQLVRQYPERAGLWFAYDEPLSHLIYAASDMFLVPSMFEPCGLTQMVAMRYGTVPVVRKTGGLNDTVFDVDHDEERAAAAGLAPNGFSFESTDTAGMDYALNRALSVWYSDKAFWDELVGRIMQQDWSWDDPAYGYISLYYKSLKR